MKQIIQSRILRKFVTLAFLIVGLAFVTSTSFTTQAAQTDDCVLQCGIERSECLAGCDDPTIWYPGCRTVCMNGYNYCVSQCPS
jgi:hypothetical protein